MGRSTETQSLLRPSIRREALQIALVSMALMMFEISLLRLFSVIMYFHLAFFALAIALFGIGLGGLYGHILRRRFARNTLLPAFAAYLPVLLGASMVLALVVLLALPLGTERVGYHVPRLRWLFFAFVAASLPFFFGSLFISLIFASRTQEAGRLYFSDLMGASVGCMLAVPVLGWLGGTTAPYLIAVVAMLPVLVDARGACRRRIMTVAALTTLAAVTLAALNLKSGPLVIRGSTLVPSRLLFSKWDFRSRITVQDDPGYRGWSLSPRYDGPVPHHLVITQDGRAPAYIVEFDGDFGKVDYLRYDLTSLPCRIVQPEELLVVGVGGGRDILTAKLYGVTRVQGVELNPIIANDVMREQFKRFAGNVYGMDGVSVAVENARTFLERDRSMYDLLYCSLADTQTGSTQGAYVLSENHLYTKEAFQAYLDRLKAGGACAVLGKSELGLGDIFLRLTATAVSALEAQGISRPGDHLLIVLAPPEKGSTAMGHCVMWTRSPVTKAMVDRAQRACTELGFELAWPDSGQPSRWTTLVAQILDPQRRVDFFSAAQNDMTPLVDDRPYLFYNTKPRDFLYLLMHPFGPRVAMRGVEIHAFYLITDLFMVAIVCVGALMLSPLIVFERRELRHGGAGQLVYLLFFFVLGIAYMLVEISLLQHLFLLLGDPVLTFAVTLCAMLAFTGLGSLISRRFPSETLRASMTKVACGVVAVQVCALLLFPRLMAAMQPDALVTKFIFVVAVVAIVATPMGMLFPSAIRLVGRSGFEITCWVWGMNGVGSVLGSVGSTMCSMNLGIRATFVAGTVCYVVALLLSRFLGKRAGFQKD